MDRRCKDNLGDYPRKSNQDQSIYPEIKQALALNSSRERTVEEEEGMFRRPPPLGKLNPLLRLAAADANSSRNQQVFRERRWLRPRVLAVPVS